MRKKEAQVLNYRVIIEKEHYEDGTPVYTAYVPTLDIADYGSTIDKVLESIKDGIELAIECLIDEGKAVPVDNFEENIIVNTQVPIPAGVGAFRF